jgi:kynureninase
VLLGAVNYLSGEVLDLPAITRAGHDVGAVVGWDLAHAAGNIALRLHEWDVDWAAWCTYKYLNSGPGSVAAAFVHRRHLADRTLPRLSGWWGAPARTRFEMRPTLDPVDSADGWALSNPPILALAPVLASLRMFDEVGLPALRERSVALTGYLLHRLDEIGLTVLTPRDPDHRGAQVSVRIAGRPADEVAAELRADYGVIADARPPDIIRLAPVPFYVSQHDCWRAVAALARSLGRG